MLCCSDACFCSLYSHLIAFGTRHLCLYSWVHTPKLISHPSQLYMMCCPVIITIPHARSTWDSLVNFPEHSVSFTCLKKLVRCFSGCLQRLGLLSCWIFLDIMFFLTLGYSIYASLFIYLFIFAEGCFNSLTGAYPDLPLAAPETHTLLIGVIIAPLSCHHSLFLRWWRPGRISSVAFEAHAVDSSVASQSLHN